MNIIRVLNVFLFLLATCILLYGSLVVYVFVGSIAGLDQSQNKKLPLGLDIL